MIAVMGATGHTGQAVTERLLQRGAKVRALGRSAERLAPFAGRGVEPAVGSVTDPAFLTRAFRGAEAVYALVPPDYAAPDLLAVYEGVGDVLVAAITGADVKRVVFLSSLGAELPSGTGPITGCTAWRNA